MADAKDGDGHAIVVEADAVVANAKAELGRFDTLEPSDIAGAGFGETFE